MLRSTYYSQNYASIIYQGLLLAHTQPHNVLLSIYVLPFYMHTPYNRFANPI